MNLIALLIGLFIERLATQLFHLRELRWLDRIIDWGFARTSKLANLPPLIPVILLVVMLALPVLFLIWALGWKSEGILAGSSYVIVAIVVLFFSLGPKDIGEDVDEYCAALEAEDEESTQRTAKAIIESDVPEDPLQRIHRVEEAVCVQANNRLFAVIFWFILTGPLGAWIYRVTDLIRRRAVFNAARDEQADSSAANVRDAATTLHGWLAWLPARLTALGYAAAGHFDAAIAALRAPDEEQHDSRSEQSDHLLARVGVAALALQDEVDEPMAARGARGARAANHLVFRLLVIWVVLISAMTLYGATQ